MLEIKKFAANMDSYDVDPKCLRKCFQTGLFEETVDVNGTVRKFYTYIKEGLLYNSRCVVVAPPDDVDTLEYIENGPWLAFAEKNDIFLHFMIPGENGWDLSGADADYMNKVYLGIQARKFYITMQDNIYAVGIGKGATVAHQATMKMTSEWSGLATFGDLTEDAMRNAAVTHKAEDMGKVELAVSAAKVQLPVWMVWGEKTGANADVCRYWMLQNNSDPEAYATAAASEVYFPSKVIKKSQVNEEQIAQVRVTNGFSGLPTAELIDSVWGYIKLACRHRSFGTKALRYYMEPQAYGAVEHSMEFDGLTRTWFEYVPDSVKKSGEAVPVVFCFHGRGGSAESFMSLSGMSRVAEERGFIAVFPEASVYQQRPGGLRNVLLWNGTYKGHEYNDTEFVLAILEEIKTRWNVDTTRVYSTGQSSGGFMTSELGWRAPKVFAAVAPWSGVRDPESNDPPPASIDPITPYFFMFGEVDWLCADKENTGLGYPCSKSIEEWLLNLMDLYHLDKNPMRYKVGEITYNVYMNPQQVPLLIVGTVKGMVHANYPRQSWISYDEYLSKFSKDADGALYYMGRKV